MKNLHLLPTKNYKQDYALRSGEVVEVIRLGQLILNKENNEVLINKNPLWSASCDIDVLVPHHIYITSSDEEIKDVRPHKGKWQLEKGQILNKFPNYLTDLSDCKLVIMTTDPDLIADGVQVIDDEFLEWFVNNPSCESVKVKNESYFTDEVERLEGLRDGENIKKEIIYKIIISKEESKQDYSGVHLRHCYQGEYENSCKYGEGDCPAKPSEEPKQEKLDIKEGNQLGHQFEEWNTVFELQSQCKKLKLSELEIHSILSNRFELKSRNKSKQETLEEIKLEPLYGSSYCQFSVIENQLATLYRNQEKILTAIKLLNNGKQRNT